MLAEKETSKQHKRYSLQKLLKSIKYTLVGDTFKLRYSSPSQKKNITNCTKNKKNWCLINYHKTFFSVYHYKIEKESVDTLKE